MSHISEDMLHNYQSGSTTGPVEYRQLTLRVRLLSIIFSPAGYVELYDSGQLQEKRVRREKHQSSARQFAIKCLVEYVPSQQSRTANFQIWIKLINKKKVPTHTQVLIITVPISQQLWHQMNPSNKLWHLVDEFSMLVSLTLTQQILGNVSSRQISVSFPHLNIW